MTASVWFKATVLWLATLLLAVLNGALREGVLIPALGSFAAFIASGIILSVCIVSVACLATPWYGRLSAPRWLLVGLYWLVLTLVFEFGFGRLVQHKTWDELLAAYSFHGANLWPVVLLVTLFAPWLGARWRGRL